MTCICTPWNNMKMLLIVKSQKRVEIFRLSAMEMVNECSHNRRGSITLNDNELRLKFFYYQSWL